MKRTPLKRRTPLKPKRSRRVRTFAEELDAITPALLERAHYLCELCRDGPIQHRHHRLRRGKGGTNDLDNLMALCLSCHESIHRYPGQSYRQGWLTRSGKDA